MTLSDAMTLSQAMSTPPTPRELEKLFRVAQGDQGVATKLTCHVDHRCFRAGTTFSFRPLTVLVGDQGTGKSTILDTFAEECYLRIHRDPYSRADAILQRRTLMFEGDPAIRHFKSERAPGSQETLSSRLDVWASEKSHGERLLPVVEFMHMVSQGILVLDEPEVALSPRSVVKVSDTIRAAVNRGCQVIIATHHPYLITKLTDEVYSLEHLQWMSGAEYLRECGYV